MKALVNYVLSSEAVVPFTFDAAWTGIASETVEVEFADVRESASPSLEQEGFCLARLDCKIADYADDDEIASKWLPAAVELLKSATRASVIVPWAYNVRYSNRSEKSRSTAVSTPARHVHSDFSEDFSPDQILGAPNLSAKSAVELRDILRAPDGFRWRAFNVWQQISPPPHDAPLALCDARTVLPEDVVIGRGTAGPLTVDLCLFRARPRHRWLHVSDMLPGEILIFSGLDRNAGGTLRRVPHTAFDHPACPPDTAPRSSIEVRVLAFEPVN